MPNLIHEHAKDTWRALEDFYKAGKARAIGISNYCAADIDTLLETATVTPHLHQVERCATILHPNSGNARPPPPKKR